MKIITLHLLLLIIALNVYQCTQGMIPRTTQQVRHGFQHLPPIRSTPNRTLRRRPLIQPTITTRKYYLQIQHPRFNFEQTPFLFYKNKEGSVDIKPRSEILSQQFSRDRLRKMIEEGNERLSHLINATSITDPALLTGMNIYTGHPRSFANFQERIESLKISISQFLLGPVQLNSVTLPRFISEIESIQAILQTVKEQLEAKLLKNDSFYQNLVQQYQTHKKKLLEQSWVNRLKHLVMGDYGLTGDIQFKHLHTLITQKKNGSARQDSDVKETLHDYNNVITYLDIVKKIVTKWYS